MALAENGQALPVGAKVSLSSRKQRLHSKLVRQLVTGQSAMGLHRKNNPVLCKLERTRRKKKDSQLAKHPKMISGKMQGTEPHNSPSPLFPPASKAF